MARDSGRRLARLAVDGGLSASDVTMQTQADVSGIAVHRPAMRETTALGAAVAAGLATGVWAHLDDVAAGLRGVVRGATVFEPRPADRRRFERMVRKWEQAVEMSRGWVRAGKTKERRKTKRKGKGRGKGETGLGRRWNMRRGAVAANEGLWGILGVISGRGRFAIE